MVEPLSNAPSPVDSSVHHSHGLSPESAPQNTRRTCRHFEDFRFRLLLLWVTFRAFYTVFYCYSLLPPSLLSSQLVLLDMDAQDLVRSHSTGSYLSSFSESWFSYFSGFWFSGLEMFLMGFLGLSLFSCTLPLYESLFCLLLGFKGFLFLFGVFDFFCKFMNLCFVASGV